MSADLSAVRAVALAALEQDVARRAQRMRNDIVETLSRPGQGRTYTHYYAMKGGRLIPVRKRAQPHQASAPGDPPAVDQGQLWQSITALQVTRGHWRVGTRLPYALWLEFGTRRMAPRPFMRPAADREREQP